MGNAVKFTHRGGVTITVEPAAAPASDPRRLALHCTVRDTGIGIPADQLDRLFKSFSQVDRSTTRQYGGSGLGLAICQRLTALMDGRIWVESVGGQGSAFQFVIEVERADHSSAAVQPALGAPAAPVFDSNLAATLPLRILLNDDPVNRKVGGAILKKIGYDPVFANNGQEALDALARQPFDVVLQDLQMPVLDGRETTRRILERYPDGSRPRIVAMTAEAMEGDREKCLAVGMDDYIPKPVRVPEVRAALERAAASR